MSEPAKNAVVRTHRRFEFSPGLLQTRGPSNSASTSRSRRLYTERGGRTYWYRQGDISRLEGRENYGDCQVNTLQRYIEAIGGTLELTASFDGKKFIIVGVAASAQSGSSANKPLQRAGRKATRR